MRAAVPNNKLTPERLEKLRRKRVFSTGDVAALCDVAPRTVSNWFDSGRLKGYRIPGSENRRIPREQLVRFMRATGIPLGWLADPAAALLVGADDTLAARLSGLLPALRFDRASGGFEAGLRVSSTVPDAVVVDFCVGRAEALGMVANMRRDPRLDGALMLGLACEDEQSAGDLAGFTQVFKRPLDLDAVALRLAALVVGGVQ